jgi:molybdopterin-guanine dinucleotide biosynthesis protein A
MGGVDKPLLELEGRSMIERIITALDTRHIAISANGDPGRFAALNVPVLDDGDFAGEGPLAGVLAGLEWAAALSADALLTVPGDTPFIPRGLAAAPACAASNGRAHNLVALWPLTCRDDLRRLLTTPGRRDIAHFASAIGMRRIDFAVAKWDPFLNVNTPEDLALARTIAEGET